MPDMHQETEASGVPSYPDGMQKSMSPAWRGNFVATLQLAWPMVLTNLAQTAMIVTDVVFIGRLGPQSLARGIVEDISAVPAAPPPADRQLL